MFHCFATLFTLTNIYSVTTDANGWLWPDCVRMLSEFSKCIAFITIAALILGFYFLQTSRSKKNCTFIYIYYIMIWSTFWTSFLSDFSMVPGVLECLCGFQSRKFMLSTLKLECTPYSLLCVTPTFHWCNVHLLMVSPLKYCTKCEKPQSFFMDPIKVINKVVDEKDSKSINSIPFIQNRVERQHNPRWIIWI